ncbi:type II toxin-antitoxin system VapC family toxin [Arachidicoccus soli]|uniref:type II toxin-antitoxin system VapC family toxin n=1 Tax=Arachidicoccus soli TaxID=2341117 RepID=UPI001968E3AE
MSLTIFFEEYVPTKSQCFINATLKKKRKQIDIADLFIAATAVIHNLSIATLNKKHFERIDELLVIG